MGNVLITKFREFTDVIMTLPVIYSACGSNPDCSFVLVTRRSLAPLFINAPSNLTVEGIDTADYAGIGGAARLWRELRGRYNPHRFIGLDNDAWTRWIALRARLAGVASSLVRNAPGKNKLIRKNNKVMLPLLTARARYREAFFRLGLPIQEHFQGLYGKGGKGDPALFDAVTPPPRPGETWIGIAPFAKHRGKSYPVEMMEEVVDILQRNIPDLKIILFGGGERERAILADWSRRHPCAVSPAVARLGFPAELSLLSYLDVMLTMDSANMHLASLVDVPVVTVWGATHPYCGYKGWHQKESRAISLPMPCRPCSLHGDRPCHRDDYHCLTAIKPQFIADRILSLLPRT